MTVRTLALAGSDPAERLRFRLEPHVVEDVVDGHDSGLAPALGGFALDVRRGFQRGGLIAQALLKLLDPCRIAAKSLLGKLQVHTGSDKLESLGDGRDQLRIDLKNNLTHSQSSIKARTQARRTDDDESGASA